MCAYVCVYVCTWNFTVHIWKSEESLGTDLKSWALKSHLLSLQSSCRLCYYAFYSTRRSLNRELSKKWLQFQGWGPWPNCTNQMFSLISAPLQALESEHASNRTYLCEKIAPSRSSGNFLSFTPDRTQLGSSPSLKDNQWALARVVLDFQLEVEIQSLAFISTLCMPGNVKFYSCNSIPSEKTRDITSFWENGNLYVFAHGLQCTF